MSYEYFKYNQWSGITLRTWIIVEFEYLKKFDISSSDYKTKMEFLLKDLYDTNEMKKEKGKYKTG